MSARFTPKDIHPSIFEERHNLASKYMAGNVLDSTGNQAVSKHFSVWASEYKKGFAFWLLGMVPVIAAAGLLPDGTVKGVKVIVALGAMLVWLGVGYLAYLKYKDVLTWKELEALRPGMMLSKSQEYYLDCLQYIEESPILDEHQKKTWREELYRALDQSIRLQELSDELKSSTGGKGHGELMAEIEKLDVQAARSSDVQTKQAYEDSARLARERMSKWDSVAVQAERTEAHLELTRQTFLKTRDTLRDLNLQPQQTVHVDLEPLRANLAKIQSDSYEIQRAIEELRQI